MGPHSILPPALSQSWKTWMDPGGVKLRVYSSISYGMWSDIWVYSRLSQLNIHPHLSSVPFPFPSHAHPMVSEHCCAPDLHQCYGFPGL